MAQIKHLNRAKQYRMEILQELVELQNNGELEEFLIVYTRNGSEYASYFYSDELKLIGLLEKVKLALMMGED